MTDTTEDFRIRVEAAIEKLRDYLGDTDMYPLVNLRLNKVFINHPVMSRRGVNLLTDWDTMNFTCLKLISEVFGTHNINFTGNEVITYPYSEYTPIPVHTGIISLRDVNLGEDEQVNK